MKFLVIQQKMIGDVLTSSILCDNLKREFPNAEVHYMVHRHTTAVIEHHPSIDRIISFDPALRKNKIRFYQYIRTLDKEQYDVLIDAYTKIETSLISWLSNIPKRFGYYKRYSAFSYSHPIKRWKKSRYGLGLAIENRLQLIMPLMGDKTMDTLIHKPMIYLKREEKEKAIALMRQHGLEGQHPIMISILGSGENKSYPATYMAALLDQIAANSSDHLLFNYIPKQLDQVRAIYDLCRPETREKIKLDLFADSLRGFIALLSQCKALIGNEGGAVNMAKGLDVPTFSIFSPWIPKGDWAIFEDTANQSVHLRDYKPELFEGHTTKVLRKASLRLYQEFVPELFSKQLETFLKNL
ncbi:glycosyltransferase family 9 protein [Robertkochia flava]|uniref:glycosyltransferase family 9 protein n=1 Tax=Robertkochia flava TaxID=3447986 RepID=UPI001CC95938|nr:glycosyltransferase family 9 protein [Robertkochia marina]